MTKRSEDESTLEIYKLLVEMADRVSQRRQAANNFYLTVSTALIGGSAVIGTVEPTTFGFLVIAIAGIAICVLWIRNIGSYKSLNDAKFKVIQNVEERLPYQPYAEEWSYLDPDGDGKKHKPFHKVEVAVPCVLAIFYALLVLAALFLERPFVSGLTGEGANSAQEASPEAQLPAPAAPPPAQRE